MDKQEKKVFYGWWILAVCILINVTTHVLNFQMGALYLKPIVAQFGISRSLFLSTVFPSQAPLPFRFPLC